MTRRLFIKAFAKIEGSCPQVQNEHGAIFTGSEKGCSSTPPIGRHTSASLDQLQCGRGFEKEVLKTLGDILVNVKSIRKNYCAYNAVMQLPKDCLALPLSSLEELMDFD
ncbi:hypothetical protein MRX96_056565 [Rhipicephalus microplus]